MLARLDGSRKASVVQFLYESELIATDRPVLDLSGADLSEQTSVADEQVLDGPEALTGETTAQIGLHAHRCQDNRGLVIDPGCELLTTPRLQLIHSAAPKGGRCGGETQPSSAASERMGLWYLDDHYPQPVRISYLHLPQPPRHVGRELDNIHSGLFQLVSYDVDVSHSLSYTRWLQCARSQTAQGSPLPGRKPRPLRIRCPTHGRCADRGSRRRTGTSARSRWDAPTPDWRELPYLLHPLEMN